MELELYHRADCTHCKTVLDFIQEAKLGDRITFFEVADSPVNLAKLTELTGKSVVPCFLCDKVPVFGADEIIASLRGLGKDEESSVSASL